jgi:hypothetical protein
MVALTSAMVLVVAACSREGPTVPPTTTTASDGSSTTEARPTPEPPIEYPADAGVFDVKRDYGAVGDGRTDDTNAIQAAIAAAAEREGTGRGRIVYFPPGVYSVSDTLEWRTADNRWSCCISLQGSGRDLTAIKLRDAAAGFVDRAVPRAVVRTASHRSSEPDGSGNEAFRNSIYDMTIDIGSDNPGATGVDWLANNIGAIRRVDIRSSDRNLSGRAGISMTRRWPGPAVISDVTITGFDIGIEIDNWQYSVTLEHVVLRNQRLTGIRNGRNALFIRDLRSDNVNAAITCGTPDAVVIMVDSTLGGGLQSTNAISGPCSLFLQQVDPVGYRSVFAGASAGPVDAYAAVSDGANLPLQPPLLAASEVPPVPRSQPADWVNVRDYGADADDFQSDSGAFQAALATGASTVYFPPGGRGYVLDEPVVVPPTLTRLAGMESVISQSPGGSEVVLKIDGASDTPLLIERVAFNRNEGPMTIELSGQRDLIVQDAGVGIIDATLGGAVYIDNAVAKLDLGPASRAWVRQLNTEGPLRGVVGNINRGGELWALGIKTEGAITAVDTSEGGRTEVLGAFLYPTLPVVSDTPAFVTTNASHQLVFVAHADTPRSNYAVQVRTTSAETNATISSDSALRRGATAGRIVADSTLNASGENDVAPN